MTAKVTAICLLAAFFGFPAAADEQQDKLIFMEFLRYSQRVYLSQAREILDQGDYRIVFGEVAMSSRVLGYSLGNLLRYARRGSENHKTWLMLEKKTREMIHWNIEKEGGLRGWDPAFIENRRKKAWEQCMAAQQGWFDASMAAITSVEPKGAPDFFAALAAGGTGGGGGEAPPVDSGGGSGGEVPDPGVLSDAILGKWTWIHEYRVPNTNRSVRQKLSIVVRRAGTGEWATAYGPMPTYLYEGHILEIENVTDEWSRPIGAPGDLMWKITYATTHRAPSPLFLGYKCVSLKGFKGEISNFRLRRNEGVLEVGNAKYTR